MRALAAGLFLIPLADQLLKLLLHRRLGSRSVPLGRLGDLRIVTTRPWMARRNGSPSLAEMWTVWLLAAGAVALLSTRVTSCGGFAGLLLGGSLSHGLESSVRGSVTDYVCLRFWPAFNLADVAITVGAIGVGLAALMSMKDLWP